jgi:hypothetical protein
MEIDDDNNHTNDENRCLTELLFLKQLAIEELLKLGRTAEARNLCPDAEELERIWYDDIVSQTKRCIHRFVVMMNQWSQKEYCLIQTYDVVAGMSTTTKTFKQSIVVFVQYSKPLKVLNRMRRQYFVG